MTMHLIVPIKRFAAAKQRLGSAWSGDQRQRLARAMAQHVLSELSGLDGIATVLVATSEPSMNGVASGHGFDVISDDASEGGLNRAIANATDRLMAIGAEDIGIILADLPLFYATDFVEIMRHHRSGPDRKMTIVMDRRGSGTNLRFCRPGNGVPPSFGADSAARHRMLAESAGVSVDVVPSDTMSLDLDEEDDIALLLKRGRSDSRFSGNGVLRLLEGAERPACRIRQKQCA